MNDSALASADHRLVQIIDAAMAEARARSTPWLACRRGCTHCCIGPFAITSLDAWRLKRGLDQLSQTDPARAARIAARAAEARARMGEPGAAQTDDEYCDAHVSLPCPVLDLETGACELYHHRPIACRLHGPAVHVAGIDLRHCRLNYAGASAAQIERCRVTVDPRGAESLAVAEFEAHGAECRRTYIAFAL